MKKLPVLFAVALVGTMGIQASRAQEVPTPPIYDPSIGLGDIYNYICESLLGGTYVNSNPNFYQAWACEGIDWCEIRPETFGCGEPTPL